MSILDFEKNHQAKEKKNEEFFSKSLEKAIKRASIQDKKIENFMQVTEGAKIFLERLENERDNCLSLLRQTQTTENLLRIQERYNLRSQDIEFIELYLGRVKPTE